jgi:hypothetical protein
MKSQKIALFLAVFLCFISSVFANNPEEKKALETSYYAWCDAIGNAKGDPSKVVKFYAKDAILLPTLSPKILMNTNHGLDAYFVSFTGHPHIRCQTDKLITQVYRDIGINTGLYTFTYDENGKTEVVKARFSFIYKKNNNQWLIINHHSSKLP